MNCIKEPQHQESWEPPPYLSESTRIMKSSVGQFPLGQSLPPLREDLKTQVKLSDLQGSPLNSGSPWNPLHPPGSPTFLPHPRIYEQWVLLREETSGTAPGRQSPELPASARYVLRVPGFPELSPVLGWPFGEAGVFGASLLLSVTPIKCTDSQSWTPIIFWIWSVVGSLCRVWRCLLRGSITWHISYASLSSVTTLSWPSSIIICTILLSCT